MAARETAVLFLCEPVERGREGGGGEGGRGEGGESNEKQKTKILGRVSHMRNDHERVVTQRIHRRRILSSLEGK